MIISASRRTDIPAFYSQWLVNRLREGFVYVRNPMNSTQVSVIPLNTDVADCIVFWTKNVIPMLKQMDVIDSMGYKYYFQFTITPYDSSVERSFIDKSKIIDGFKMLSERIGGQRVIWRYDPIIVNDLFPVEYHFNSFDRLCRILCGYTSRCVLSFIDLYDKTKQNGKGIVESEVDHEDVNKIAGGFSEIARSNHIVLETCCEKIDLSKYGIRHTSCIDQEIIENIIGYSINGKKDRNQREHCWCIESIDIGAYDSCLHGCVYCYATLNTHVVSKNVKYHDANSPLLIGKPKPNDKITNRAVKSLKNLQVT